MSGDPDRPRTFQGPQEVREEAKRALHHAFFDSLKLACVCCGGLAAVAAGFLGVYAAAGWLQGKASVVAALLVGWALSLPVLVVVFELRRLITCRIALKDVLVSEIAYEDVLREVRQERDDTKNELQLQYAQTEVRLAELRAHYIHELANTLEAKAKSE